MTSSCATPATSASWTSEVEARAPGLLAPSRPAGAGRAAVLLGLALLAVLFAACTGGGAEPPRMVTSSAEPASDSALATPPPLQGDDLVDLTVYFRAGQGVAAHLEPVVREVPVSDDLPRKALELLLEGPAEDDGTLEPPLPVTTKIRNLTVEGGTAHVDLSTEVIRDAAVVGRSSANEALAMAALANTLTEFTSIERVDLEVEGEHVSEFWGGWGLPDVLIRDESLIGSASSVEREGLVELSRFSNETQEVGSAAAAPVRITSIRVRDRITHTRFVLELADVEDPEDTAKVPPVRVRRANDDIVLLLNGFAALDTEDGEAHLDVDPQRFRAAQVDADELAGTLRLVLSPTDPRAYWLHTLAKPTRVVLDVKK